MKTINASFTGTDEQLMYFAQKKGYQPTIKSYEKTDGEEIVLEKDNPQTLDDFLKEWTSNLLLQEISQPIAQDIQDQIQKASKEEAEKQITATKEQLEKALNVEII